MFGRTRRPYAQTVLALCTIGFLVTMVARVVISPVVPDITDAFGVSTGAIGFALSGMWAAYAFAQFPSGVLADRFGERIVVLSAIGLTGVASLLLALSPNIVLFFVFAVCLGGASGLLYSAAVSLVTKQPSDTGQSIGIFIAGGLVAGVVAPPIAATVAIWYDWRVAVGLGVVIAVPVFIMFQRGVRPAPPAKPQASMRGQFEIRSVIALLGRPGIAFTIVLTVLGAFTWQAIASFLPAFLETVHGVSRTQAGLLFAGFFLMNGLTQPITGVLSDHFTRDSSVLLTMTAGILGFVLLIEGGSLISLVAAIVFLGFAMSWGAPLQSKLMDRLPSEEQGSGFGLARTVYMGLGSLGSVVTGVIVDMAGWVEAFSLLGILMALGAGLILIQMFR